VNGYIQVRERVSMQFREMADRFRQKMKDFVQPNSANMVFTEDLKHMIHLANNNEEDLDLIEQMILKFNKQSRDLRFGSFIFGPVVMRMYHHLNRPKEALKIFMNPDLDQFFNQIISFQILMDLLLRNEMYDEVLQVMEVVKDKQLQGSRYPRNIVVLAMAAVYKQNTPESFEYMKKLWREVKDAGHEPMRRAITFAAALAINQKSPHVAVELLSEVPRQNYVTVRNLKAAALADLDRADDALPVLRSVIEVDTPGEVKNTFCADVIAKVKEAVDRSDKKEVHQEFQRILEQLTQLGYITDASLDSQLYSEIEKVTLPSRPRTQDQRILAAKFERQDRGSGRGYQGQRQRIGLADME